MARHILAAFDNQQTEDGAIAKLAGFKERALRRLTNCPSMNEPIYMADPGHHPSVRVRVRTMINPHQPRSRTGGLVGSTDP
jgi:hypothetical protein